MQRCFWVDEKSDIYIKYHDEEWGVPKYDDRELFELLILESFQAGLSWLTVLKKREAFREAFDRFDVQKVANYGEKKINELLGNENIIRSRGKIIAAINNAKIFIQIQKEFGSFSKSISSALSHFPSSGTRYSSPIVLATYSLTLYLSTKSMYTSLLSCNFSH